MKFVVSEQLGSFAHLVRSGVLGRLIESLVVVSLFVVGICFPSSAKADEPHFPLVKFVKGTCRFGKSATQGDLVKAGSEVPLGAQITTGADGLVAIQWQPGLESVLFENGSVTFISLGRAPTSHELDIILTAGTLYSRSDGGLHLVILTGPGRILDQGSTFFTKLADSTHLEVGVASGALKVPQPTPTPLLILTAGNQASIDSENHGSPDVSEMPQANQDKLIQTLAKYFGESGPPTGNEQIGQH